jgi:superfamily I DNA and/or RNA helicase
LPAKNIIASMNQREIWKKYITAQSKILEHKSKPIGIDTSKAVQLDGLKLHLSIDQEIFKQVFKKEVEQIFKVKDFDFSSGYIQTSVDNTTNIKEEQLTNLKELAEICYIDFNDNPVIEGVVTAASNNSKEELKAIIGELPTTVNFIKLGQLHLTTEEWKKASAIRGIKFSKKATARFNIKPSIKFITETIFEKQFFLDNYNDLATSEELPNEVFEYLKSNLNLSLKQIMILIKFDIIEDSDTLEKANAFFRENTNYHPHKTFDNHLLIRLEKRKLKKIGQNSFDDAKDDIRRILDTNFKNNKYNIENKFFYSFDKGAKYNAFYDSFLESNQTQFELNFQSKEESDLFRLDNTFDAIYFDFETEDELNEKLNKIKSIPYLEIYDRGENHKYKFNIKFENGLQELQAILKSFVPDLSTKLISNGEKLIFRHFYQTGNKTEVLSRLINQLDDYFTGSENFSYTIHDTFQEKYLCEENFELKVEQEEEKLSNLLREDFYFGTTQEKFYLGKLQKVDYPDLYFKVDEDKLQEVEENISQEKIKAVFPELKGEKDKIKRLEDTVLKLDDEKSRLPNDNAKVFLYDSSKAKKIENIEYLLNKTSVEWQDFESNLFSESLNESQRQAIYKSLYAEELALIQGPPGTGKSTAIAEIIWQHIRVAQKEKKKTKILLTSETNLAVDNAIDRLKNNQNNIVKPIRFGNTENLESEGYFYSLEAIKNWEKSNVIQNNTVSHWVTNIVNRVTQQENEQINSALNNWKSYLQNPTSETKKLFADKYLEYVNLIGATGSSIGKLNSENKWTSFFRSYLNVFNKESYEKNDFKSCNRTDINFDTIIMDEASKATPPELALPVLYGKKSIIVGDHRQLPPMIDGEEIKDILVSIGEKALAKALSHKEFETSQFERLFKHIDESIKGTFDTQYRMHPAINDVIAQFYTEDSEKGLLCGLPPDEAYHNSFVKWDSRYHGLKYKNLVTPETHTIWINVNTPEIQEGTSRVNFGEIDAIDKILQVLKNSEGKSEFDKWLSNKSQEEKQIGLISFYGKQINYIEQMLVQNHTDLYKGKGKINDKENLIRLSTVDRFQGMERNIIIVSMVRSNKIAAFQGQQPDYNLYPVLGYPAQVSLGFAESPNRLNVALSRAKRLLIVVGNSEHFCQKAIYNNVYDKMQKIINAEELQKAVVQNG